MFSNIPGELRSLPQWVVADMTINPETGLPKKHPLNPRTGQLASVTDPTTWGTFEEAIHTGAKHIGFVLAPTDPFCIIDLDNKPNNPASPAELDRHNKILAHFDSYTERSVSGTGFHIIIRGSVPTGVHRDKVEVYSSGRYMICTGDVVRASPIVDYQPLLSMLYNEVAPPVVATLEDHDEVMSDADLLDMACNAANADKFKRLCRGEWQGEYPSQSEADFALLSMLTFYSQSNEQVRNIFRMTELGKRDKATRDNKYLDRALRKLRGEQGPQVDLSELITNAQVIMAQIKHNGHNPCPVPAITLSKPHTTGERQLANITLPPGLVGELATYFFQTAIRPVPEIALVAAIALVAGVVGRSYNISGSGLNQYLIVLAKTGSGKEGAASGIENLIAAIRPRIPMADQFLGPAAFASGQALIKVLDTRPCFVSVLGEFGLTLQELSDHRANSAQKMLKKVLLDLYAKSGWGKTLRSSVYSDVEKNTKIIQAPNVTILGESTPETFYYGLDASHIAEGLIPRFSIIQYKGDRPARNRNSNIPPSPQLTQRFSDLISVALTTTNNNTCCPVAIDPEALVLLDDFDTEADHIMNASKQDVEMQLWNRAHLKVLKLSALLAVGINPHAPVVTRDAAQWAIDFIKNEVEGVAQRFNDGDVGQGDSKQMHDMKRIIERFFTDPIQKLEKYDLTPESAALFRKNGAVPYGFMLKRASALSSFKNDRLNATNAVRKTLQAMTDAGTLSEIQNTESKARFKFNGKCYLISGKL